MNKNKFFPSTNASGYRPLKELAHANYFGKCRHCGNERNYTPDMPHVCCPDCGNDLTADLGKAETAVPIRKVIKSEHEAEGASAEPKAKTENGKVASAAELKAEALQLDADAAKLRAEAAQLEANAFKLEAKAAQLEADAAKEALRHN